MIFRQTHRRERGVALLIAIFGLVLLSAIGMALLFGSDTETAISTNYRDKQVAMYAAVSALHEARDRINGPKGDLALAKLVPTDVPSKTSQNVLYILNLAPGDKEPWVATLDDGSPNPLYDTELCQENLTGFSSNPCTLPAGVWYKQAPAWDATKSIAYKWVRVTLKTDNATPVTVTGPYEVPVAGTTGRQACWDGLHQQQKPSDFPTNCMPIGGKVTRIAITSPGSGYTLGGTFLVNISGGGGTGATAIAHIGPLPAGVTSVVLDVKKPGSGYGTTPPLVHIGSDGYGSGAAAHAVLGGGVPLKDVTLQDAPTPACYLTAPTLNVSTTYGSGATGVAVLTDPTKCIYSITATGTCSIGPKDSRTKDVTGPGGFTGKVTLDKWGNYSTSAVTNPGNFDQLPTDNSGFTVAGCPNVKVAIGRGGAHVQAVSLIDKGTYVKEPTATFVNAVPATGSGPLTGMGVLDGVPTVGQIKELILDASGSGYKSDPPLTIDPPCTPYPECGGVQAEGHAFVVPNDNGVISIECCGTTPPNTTTSGGTGYVSSPTVTIAGPPPCADPTEVCSHTTATAVATIGPGAIPYRPVYLLTALAQTKGGARAMAQMEVTPKLDSWAFNLGGALTLAGPSPTFGTPQAAGFTVDGNDGNSCGEEAAKARPAIGVYDDPNNPTQPTAVSSVIGVLGKPDNYIGAHAAPDVENVFSSLGGDKEQGGLTQYLAAAQYDANLAGTYYTPPPGTSETNFDRGEIDPSTGVCTRPVVSYVDGDASMGPVSGCGILVVTGTLTFSGNYNWKGLILVIGKGDAVFNGGGNGLITGALFVANLNGAASGTLGAPAASYSGGGSNSIKYDHCYADNYLSMIPYVNPPISPKVYQVLSLRTLIN